MTDEWLHLDADEAVTWVASPRLTSMLGGLLAGLLIVAAGIGLATSVDVRFALVVVGGVGTIGWSYLAVRNTRFVVTTHALYAKTGVVGVRVRRVPLDRVQNSSFSQGVRGRLFGYGSVQIETAGGPGIRFFNVESPRESRRLVDRQTRTEGTEIPGTVEQWNAILSEVSALRVALADDGRSRADR